MALIRCQECGKEVSDKAANCPNCGCPIAGTKQISIAFPVPRKPGLSTKCFVRTTAGEVLASCRHGETVKIHMEEEQEICITMESFLGKAIINAIPGKKYKVDLRGLLDTVTVSEIDTLV